MTTFSTKLALAALLAFGSVAPLTLDTAHAENLGHESRDRNAGLAANPQPGNRTHVTRLPRRASSTRKLGR